MKKMMVFLTMSLLTTQAFVFAETPENTASFTDVAIGQTSDHEVRFTSGTTVYVEALIDGQWVGRYRCSSGRIPFPYWMFKVPAFELEIKTDPAADAVTQLSTGWQFVSASEISKTDRGARHFVVELSNTTRPIGVKVHTLLDGTQVFVRWLEITNTSDKPIGLTKVSPLSGRLWPGGRLGSSIYKLLCQTPANEGAIWVGYEWKVLPGGPTKIESVQGNGYDDPFFIAYNEELGQYFVCHLAWPANWQMEFLNEGGLSFRIGPSAKDLLRVIAPRETIRTPAVHLGHIEGDLDAAVQAMHDHIRRFVLPRRNQKGAYLIQFNLPGDQGYFVNEAFNEDNVIKSIDLTAAIGGELFLLDCPWYDVYGDWVPSTKRFPHGLKPLVDYAHKKGLLFGLQTEIEGGRLDWSRSKIKQQHPDWFGPGNVMFLDKPEVAMYMQAELSRVIDEYKPDLYRNEFIPARPGDSVFQYMMEFASTQRSGFMENNYWRHYDNWYSVWENLRTKYPDIIWQQCANGSTREDLGAIGQFDESYTNEAPPLFALPAYSGKTLALPPEILVIGLGTPQPEGHLQTGLRLQFTLTTPHIVVGPTPTALELTPAIQKEWLRYANLYKQFIRPMLPTCKVYHHEPVNSENGSASGPWFAMEFASPDHTKGWATIVHIRKSQADTYLFRPRGLDPGKKYKITFDNSGASATIDGLRLIQEGLPIRLETVMSSELLLFESL